MEPQKNTVEESANSSDGETTVEPRRKVVEESASSSDSEKTMDPRRNIVEESANSSHRTGATLETLDENLPSQCFEDRKTPSPKELNISYHTPSSDFEDNFSAMEKRIFEKEDQILSRNPPHRKGKKGGMRTEKW
ncbi:hypothetical protein TNIN_148001 [Trichonephila inaurata madagascariensis]|uniref:Uncharacterized protein n=1 Tax=Trichonephila inaurata madagascariensis TaxID=2747483 RepID=A0A8X6XML5_9ARAC|nr:hypothetical protein TNIN_148001 [Trichonephila inaurata madagascariensis]